jgi:opacity protein-like surface antigen
MRILNRRFLASVMLAAAVLAALAMSASAASPVKITNCNKASSRPKALTLTCGDANSGLSGLSWSTFGGTKASARGTFEMNTCTPNCAQGKTVKYPVTVTASDPRTCKAGLRVYDKVSLRFTGRVPKSANSLKRWTLGCPT